MTTTTSALPRKTLRGGRILRMASGSLWLAQEAGATIRSLTRSPTRRSTTTTPTACSNSPCTRRATIGSLSLWRARPLATPALRGATERPVGPDKGAFLGHWYLNFREFPFRDCPKRVCRVVIRYCSMHEKEISNRPLRCRMVLHRAHLPTPRAAGRPRRHSLREIL